MPMAKGRVSFRMTSFAMKACIPILCHCVIFGPTESRVICPPGARRRPGVSRASAGAPAPVSRGSPRLVVAAQLDHLVPEPPRVSVRSCPEHNFHLLSPDATTSHALEGDGATRLLSSSSVHARPHLSRRWGRS